MKRKTKTYLVFHSQSWICIYIICWGVECTFYQLRSRGLGPGAAIHLNAVGKSPSLLVKVALMVNWWSEAGRQADYLHRWGRSYPSLLLKNVLGWLVGGSQCLQFPLVISMLWVETKFVINVYFFVVSINFCCCNFCLVLFLVEQASMLLCGFVRKKGQRKIFNHLVSLSWCTSKPCFISLDYTGVGQPKEQEICL